MKFDRLRSLVSHPLTQTARTIVRRVVATAAVILAVAFVTTVSVDLGPPVRERAEREATRLMQRGVHIGRLSIVLWNGRYELHDFVIDGLTPQSRPFLTAKLISVSMLWSPLFEVRPWLPSAPDEAPLPRRVVLDEIVMRDWDMFVEMTEAGVNSFPKFPQRQADGPRRWTVTLQHVSAENGQFTYDDRATPWSVVARNLNVVVARPSEEYRGEAQFSNGVVKILNYLPFRADMNTTFKIDGGRVLFDAINLTTDGTRSVLTGDVNLSHWPEQMYRVKSTIDLPRMRRIFFANDRFELTGTSEFDGVFHLFKDVRPDGTQRTGRELKGDFYSRVAHVNDYRFDDLRGVVRWIPEALEVHDASARVFDGRADFEYSMAPLGSRGVPATNRFDATYENLNLTTLTGFFELEGIRLAGTVSGRDQLAWPSGRFAERQWTGEARVTPPPGVTLMTRRMPLDQIAERRDRGEELGPFSPHTPQEPVAVGGILSYRLDPQWVDIGPSQVATESTYVEFAGRTAYGERSEIPFHVSSSDWQDSDRIFAGLLTAFGSRTNAIPVGGYGTFDGVMRNAFRRPRIEGTFAGEQMRAFNTVWGAVRGDAVIENSYAEVKNVVITDGASTIRTEGRFSLGFPRRDGGEEINARVAIERRPVADLKHAFGLDEYRLDGTFSGAFDVHGEYLRPFGSGSLRIDEGVAYGERFETATADVLLEGNGVRLTDIRMSKGGGAGSGVAFVGWNGTYSFNFEARNIAVETLDATSGSTLPLSGLVDLTASGNGDFDSPKYTVSGTIRDLFVADEGIGRVVGDLTIDGDLLTIKLEAASSRLAVSGGGQITLNDAMDAELTFSVADTSLDPYIRAFQPRLSPYTNAVASGTIRVFGELADIDQLFVDAVVDRVELRLLDYVLRNASPIRMALDRHSVRVSEMVLVGQDTQLDLAGNVDLHNERLTMRLNGDANLGILQGFVPDISSRGQARLQATLEGPMRDPVLSGRMTVSGGRVRHFSLPHALDSITGVVSFDTRGIRLDELSAELGRGPVQFGGTIGVEGYAIGRIDVSLSGRDMELRFPQGMRSIVDADLALRGTVEAMTLSGSVNVRQAVYSGNFDTGGSGFFGLGGGGDPAVPTFVRTTLPLSFDVTIRADSSVRVRNDIMSGVVASADLRLGGTYDRPVLFGDIDIEDGEIEFEGRRYEITRARVSFFNPTRIEPFFDIETEARIRVPGETYRVFVRAVGLDPIRSMTFSSDPELPQYELLALLAGDIAPGRDVEFRQYAEVTPQEQLLRERVSRALTGVVSSEVTRLFEQSLGVDTFQLTTSLIDPGRQSARLDPAARITIGQRLSDTIYLTYSRSLSSSTRDQFIMVEIDQTDQVSWILSRNEDGTYALDLRVRRTF